MPDIATDAHDIVLSLLNSKTAISDAQEAGARDLYYEMAPDTPCADAVSTRELRALVASGSVLPTSRVWREGMADWAALRDRPSLADCLQDPS